MSEIGDLPCDPVIVIGQAPVFPSVSTRSPLRLPREFCAVVLFEAPAEGGVPQYAKALQELLASSEMNPGSSRAPYYLRFARSQARRSARSG